MSYLSNFRRVTLFSETLRHLTLAAAAASPPGVDRQRRSEQKGVVGVEELGHVILYTNDLRYCITPTWYVYVCEGARGGARGALAYTTDQKNSREQAILALQVRKQADILINSGF